MDIIPAKVMIKKYIRPKYACIKCKGTKDESKERSLSPDDICE